MTAIKLDDMDHLILRELERDGRITNVELARRIGITAPPMLRRVRALEEAGVIRGYRACLDESALGYEVAAFAMVQLVVQAESDLHAFRERIASWEIVRESWMLSGEIDFLLKCLAPNWPAFQTFVNTLTATENVRTVKTATVLGQNKELPLAPVRATR